jgi:hypothetical protein
VPDAPAAQQRHRVAGVSRQATQPTIDEHPALRRNATVVRAPHPQTHQPASILVARHHQNIARVGRIDRHIPLSRPVPRRQRQRRRRTRGRTTGEKRH